MISATLLEHPMLCMPLILTATNQGNAPTLCKAKHNKSNPEIKLENYSLMFLGLSTLLSISILAIILWLSSLLKSFCYLLCNCAILQN